MPITHKRGDTLEIYADLSLDGAPLDLTGYTVRAQMWVANGVAPFFEFTIQEVDFAAGQIVMPVPFATVKQWPVGAYVYDIEITSPGGVRYSTPTDTIDIVADVTRTV